MWSQSLHIGRLVSVLDILLELCAPMCNTLLRKERHSLTVPGYKIFTGWINHNLHLKENGKNKRKKCPGGGIVRYKY